MDSKKRFQLLASLVVAAIVLVGFAIFSIMARNNLYNDLTEQALADNKVIGESVLNILKRTQRPDSSGNDANLIADFHFACNEIKLPNDGFLCVARQEDGVLVAKPGLPFGKTADPGAQMVSFDRSKTVPIKGVARADTFRGYFEIPSAGHSDIVVGIPYAGNYRLLVHQSAAAIKANANKHTSMFLLLGSLIAVAVSGFVYFAINRLTSRYESQIAVQNKQLESANGELQQSFDQISAQKAQIERQSEDIQDSITYGSRIQQALLPSDEIINQYLPHHFILWKPRNIVSGDFYWISRKNDKLIVASIDCTGHGVPGAFMSMIGNTLLNQIINEAGITEPDEILNQLHLKVRSDLKQAESSNRDGMDVSLCVIEPDGKKLTFAGANNPLWYRAGAGELLEIKADKRAIGGYQDEDQRKFTPHVIDITEKTTFYLFSDGITDQFGGENGRKIGAKRIKEIIDQLQNAPLAEQKTLLNHAVESWSVTPEKKYDQTDDILMIGFEVQPR